MKEKQTEFRCTSDFVLWEKRIYLVKRKYDPFKGFWALPGGHVDAKETFRDAALRELQEETGGVPKDCEYLMTLDDPNRDPRGHYVSQVFHGENSEETPLTAADDASDLRSFTWEEVLEIDNTDGIAFDHFSVIEKFFSEKH